MGSAPGRLPWRLARSLWSGKDVSVWTGGCGANVLFGVSTVSERPLRHPMYEGYQRPYIGFRKFRASLWEFG